MCVRDISGYSPDENIIIMMTTERQFCVTPLITVGMMRATD